MIAIDLFAGSGGFSEGARRAGVEVIWAANHWQQALDFHRLNHPDTEHSCQDLQQANFAKVPDHDLLLASPACQGHSRARGKERQEHDDMRSTAWAVVSAADIKRPQTVVVENVPDFIKWEAYSAWKLALECFGYKVTQQVIDAADLGVPQNRERMFVVANLGQAISIKQPRFKHRPIGPHIDWNWPRWSRVCDKVQATRERAAAGREACGERFVMPYYSSGSGKTGRSLERPIGTIVTKDRWAVVDGDRMRMLQVSEARAAMGFPVDYILPEAKTTALKMLGNAVVPAVAKYVIQQIERSRNA